MIRLSGYQRVLVELVLFASFSHKTIALINEITSSTQQTIIPSLSRY